MYNSVCKSINKYDCECWLDVFKKLFVFCIVSKENIVLRVLMNFCMVLVIFNVVDVNVFIFDVLKKISGKSEFFIYILILLVGFWFFKFAKWIKKLVWKIRYLIVL